MAAFLACGGAEALETDLRTTPQGKVLLLSGEFRRGDTERLRSLLASTPVMEVHLDSPGGMAVEGLSVGKLLREHKVATRVTHGRECASSCFLAFLGGSLRSVEKGGRLGVHMHSAAHSDAYIKKLRDILTERRLSMDDRIRLIVMLNEQMSANIAAMIAAYVVRMGVAIEVFDPLFSTIHLDIHWLSEREMRNYNVVNIIE